VCGPEGFGYEIELTKPAIRSAIKDALPFLQVSLAVLSVGLKVFTGLNVPYNSAISELLQDNPVQDLLDASAGALDSIASIATELPDADGQIYSSCDLFKSRVDVNDVSFSPAAIEAAISRLNPRTVCESVRVLMNSQDSILAQTGLLLAISPSGMPEWVFNLPEVIASYEEGSVVDADLLDEICKFRKASAAEQREKSKHTFLGKIANTSRACTRFIMRK
jgi:hypothetical protein